MKLIYALGVVALSVASPAIAQVQNINTIAGTGIGGFGGDGGVSTGALLHAPLDVKVDGSGNVFILDFQNHRVRMINTLGTIVTYAGTGNVGNSGDGSVSTSADMVPFGLALDKNDNLYLSDAGSAVIRKINRSTGIISTIAGSGMHGNSGNGGTALLAKFQSPYGIAIDTAGNLYVADGNNHNVRKISKMGVVTQFAGNDTAGYSGDDGFGITARLDSPYAVAVDRKGNVFISDMKRHVVRRVDKFGIITTYAGNGTSGYSGDGGPANMAMLNRPGGLGIDSNGVLYIADAENNVIRMVDTFGVITTVVGNGSAGFGGDLGPVNGCNLLTPYGVTIDKNGSLYVADANNQRVRKTYTPVGVAGTPETPSVTVFPNPSSKVVVVSGVTARDVIYVSDMAGRVVLQQPVITGGDAKVEVSQLAAGVYVVRVDGVSGNVMFARLVKQ